MTSTRFSLPKRLLLLGLLIVISLTLAPTASAQSPNTFATITAQNAAQLKWQRNVSNGSLVNVVWSADKKSLYAITNAGVYRYDSSDLTAAPTLVSGSYAYTFDAYFSPDNKWVATSIDPGGKLRLTNLVTGEFWIGFEELKSNWSRVQFLGDRVLAISNASRLWVYDVKQKRVVRTIDGISDMTLSPDGKQLVVVDTRGLALWDAVTLQQVARFPKKLAYTSGMRFSKDGTIFYDFVSDTAFYAFDVNTHQLKYQVVASGSTNIQFAEQGNLAILWGASTDTPFVQTVDLTTGKRVYSLRVTDSIQEYTPPTYFAVISPDGSRAATVSWDGKLRVWDVTNGKMISERRNVSSPFLIFSPDGKNLLMSSTSNVLRYDYTANTVEPLAGDYGYNTTDIAFSPDNRFVSTANQDNVVRLWKVGEWDHLYELRPPGTANTYQSYSAASKSMLIGTSEGAWLYNLDQVGKAQSTSKDFAQFHDGLCQLTAYSPNGKVIACIADTTVTVWNAEKKTFMWDYAEKVNSADQTYLSTMTFSGDSKYLVIASFNNTLTVLDLATLKFKIHDLTLNQSLGSIAASPDGKSVAAADGDNIVHVYDIATGKQQWSVHGRGRSTRGFRSFIAYSPDGSLIASTDQAKKIRFFEAATGKVVAELEPNTSGEGNYEIDGLAFSPDGKLLAGTTSIGVIGLWAVTP